MYDVKKTARLFLSNNIPFSIDELLSKHTTFHIGGPADFFVEPLDAEQAIQAFQIACENSAPVYVLGEGSNILFDDAGFSGVIIHLKNLCSIVQKGNIITAGAGAKLWDVCQTSRKASLSGLAFAYGIPGSVGGAVYMNAGAFDGEIGSVVNQVVYWTPQKGIIVSGSDVLGFGYRTSIFQKENNCILSVAFQLKEGDRNEISSQMETFWHMRQEKQPLEYPSAGSTFRRPAGAFAGALIEKSALKGYRIGDAAVSDKHCGFIVNVGKASCSDVLELIKHVRTTVEQKTGHRLELEIQHIGKQGERISLE